MRVLLDTNVLLDMLLKCEPSVAQSRDVWQAMYDGRIIGYDSAAALTDVFYIARRLAGLEAARRAVRTSPAALEICVVDRQALEHAEALPGNDFEDNLQIACATLSGLDAIVTRDKQGFTGATVPALTPAEFLTQLS